MSAGRSKEISTEGMKVEFSDPVPVGTQGIIDLKAGDLSVMLPVRVTRSDLECHAMQFILDTQDQRDVVNRLVACLAGPRPCTSLIPRD